VPVLERRRTHSREERGDVLVGPIAEWAEPEPFSTDSFLERAWSGDTDLMAGRPTGICERDERAKVAETSRRCEKDSHSRTPLSAIVRKGVAKV